MNTIRLNTIGDSPVVVKKGSQVQSQEKTVEITENGTTEVVPDAGFSLSKVTVNANVQGGGEIVYVKSANLSEGAAPMLLSMFGVISAVKNNGATYIMPPSTATNMFPDAEVVGVGYMPDMEVVLSSGRATIAENFAKSGVTEDVLAPAIITKEEFYAL